LILPVIRGSPSKIPQKDPLQYLKKKKDLSQISGDPQNDPYDGSLRVFDRVFDKENDPRRSPGENAAGAGCGQQVPCQIALWHKSC
jgi:hypothetical protein